MHTKFLIFIALLCSTAFSAQAENAREFISKLRSHYQATLPIQAYSIQYHFLNKVYREQDYWDYKMPNRHWSHRRVEVDLVNRHFYDNDTLYFTGGRIYDRVQFQNDTEGYFYEKSASSLGKRFIRRNLEYFDNFIKHSRVNIDFLAVRPLLKESDIDGKITLAHKDDDTNQITLVHKESADEVVKYTFNLLPLQLASIDKGIDGGYFVYDDYQTTDGFTFARSVLKYYDGAKEPYYISFNDSFNVIDAISADKLKLPSGYGPEWHRGDRILKATEIGTDLYLVTDSSSVSNALLQVIGSNIRVFGAAVNTGFAEKTIKLIQDTFPQKNIQSIYVTHPHSRQISGLKPFVELGVEVLADAYTISAIMDYPDFQSEISKFKFREIEHEQVLDGVHYYVLESLASKRQSFVYFEGKEVIFQSHFLHIPSDNSIAKVVPTYSITFIDFLRDRQLKFNRIVGNYLNNNISREVVNKTYNALM